MEFCDKYFVATPILLDIEQNSRLAYCTWMFPNTNLILCKEHVMHFIRILYSEFLHFYLDMGAYIHMSAAVSLTGQMQLGLAELLKPGD